MKLPPYLSTSLVAGAFLLAGSFALAQTTSAANNMHPRDAASGQSSGRRAQPGNAAGMAVNEQGSRGHNGIPAQSIAVDHAGGNGVRRSTDTPTSGVNPLYESKDKANLKPNAGTSNVQPYKDGEDMTTRYRPGNNKTTRHMDGGQNTGTSSNPSPSAATQNRKHIARVKYEDRMSEGGNGARGMAVNEQGSRGSAQIYKRH